MPSIMSYFGLGKPEDAESDVGIGLPQAPAQMTQNLSGGQLGNNLPENPLLLPEGVESNPSTNPVTPPLPYSGPSEPTDLIDLPPGDAPSPPPPPMPLGSEGLLPGTFAQPGQAGLQGYSNFGANPQAPAGTNGPGTPLTPGAEDLFKRLRR